MNKMTNNQIKTIGNFLSTYHSDLNYIRNFERFKNDKISHNEFISKEYGSFYSFLIEFRVIRNVNKNQVSKLLKETNLWIEKANADDVDKFAMLICKKGLTHGKVMTSLASKILFLNNPWVIFPFDNLAKKTLNQKTNEYSDYVSRIGKYKNENIEFAKSTFKTIELYIKTIESEYKNDLKDISSIRYNRFMDKLLWTGVKMNN
jgi:hypothetical protein